MLVPIVRANHQGVYQLELPVWHQVDAAWMHKDPIAGAILDQHRIPFYHTLTDGQGLEGIVDHPPAILKIEVVHVISNPGSHLIS